MKQHITVEQLKEIKSIEQFVKLYKIVRLNKKISDKRIANFYLDIINNYGFGPNKLLSEITIGKMIEILQSKYLVGMNNFINKMYVVKLLESEFDFELAYETDRYDDLCDALWEAVKFVLRE